ncbi:hypothetical protein MWN41_01625 [Ornithobacterium rhinotracheale]|uniref:hypothetical protein n=1 Tax=Ornithobacterium rhinotracheale TaxID=28251 RepID=UPI001FF3D0E9|nr:hypothetical protein [Ornithobacterium rhinotracheale]MCK0201715.1 hypothetical protein [Ornithobacterium rhinotracheale]
MKNILFMVALAFGMVSGYAQLNGFGGQYDQNAQPNRWRLGMGAGLSFGNNNYMALALAPSLGYELGNGLEAGATLGYQYSKNDYYKSNLFSGGPYVNYMFVPQFFGRIHYEYFYGEQKIENYAEKAHINESALWLGGGYQTVGKVSLRVGVMYNVLYTKYTRSSIFSSAIRPFAGVVFAM